MPCSVSLITVMLINMLINMTINMTFIRQIKVKQSNNQCSFKLLMNWMPIDGYITWLLAFVTWKHLPAAVSQGAIV